MENESYYDVVDNFPSKTSNEDNISEAGSSTDIDRNTNIVGKFDISNVTDNALKYKIVQGHWNKLYLEETSLRLQDTVKKYIFKKHYEDDGTLDWNEMAEDYDPLIF